MITPPPADTPRPAKEQEALDFNAYPGIARKLADDQSNSFTKLRAVTPPPTNGEKTAA